MAPFSAPPAGASRSPGTRVAGRSRQAPATSAGSAWASSTSRTASAPRPVPVASSSTPPASSSSSPVRDAAARREGNDMRILLAGAGAVGTRFAALLAAVGVGIVWVVDDERVASENVHVGGYEAADVGSYKAEVVVER